MAGGHQEAWELILVGASLVLNPEPMGDGLALVPASLTFDRSYASFLDCT